MSVVEDFIKWFIAVSPAVVAGTVAYLTVRQTAKVFYKQKWWERKFETYSSIIDSLFLTTEFWHRERRRLHRHDEEVPQAEYDAFVRRFKEAEAATEKAGGMGDFIISTSAAKALDDVRTFRAMRKLDEPYENVIEASLSGELKALQLMRLLAKADLEVK